MPDTDWKFKLNKLIEKTHQLPAFKEQDVRVTLIKKQFSVEADGRLAAVLSFIADATDERPFFGIQEDLFELRPSQTPPDSVEVQHSQPMLVIYGDSQQTIALKIEDRQIYLSTSLTDAFLMLFKTFYMFNMKYPIRMKQFYQLIELIFDVESTEMIPSEVQNYFRNVLEGLVN